MDMLEIHQLQTMTQRILKQTTKDGDCLVWMHSENHDGSKAQPRIRAGGRTSKQIRCIEYLWQHTYGTPAPKRLSHACPNGKQCLNLDHKQLFKGVQPKKTDTPKRVNRYNKHTSECGGIDPVVIERVLQAGSVYELPNERLCDCERAYILKYVPGGHHIIGRPSSIHTRKLLSINI